MIGKNNFNLNTKQYLLVGIFQIQIIFKIQNMSILISDITLTT
jgi:hypothetical protein